MKFLSVPETPNLFATRRYNLISHYRLGTGAARVITHIFIPVIASYVTTSRKFHERSARVALINAPITIIATELELRSRAFADLKTRVKAGKVTSRKTKATRCLSDTATKSIIGRARDTAVNDFVTYKEEERAVQLANSLRQFVIHERRRIAIRSSKEKTNRVAR